MRADWIALLWTARAAGIENQHFDLWARRGDEDGVRDRLDSWHITQAERPHRVNLTGFERLDGRCRGRCDLVDHLVDIRLTLDPKEWVAIEDQVVARGPGIEFEGSGTDRCAIEVFLVD